MPAFFARNIRNIALMLLVALATVTVALISSGTTAQANTYTYAGPGGTVANTNEIEIDYVWSSNNDRVTIGLVKPTGLEAVWTNTVTSESFTVAITDSATTTITNQTPVNTWASGTKVKLVVKARSGVSVPTLNGINNELQATNSRMFEVISLGNFSNFTNLLGAFANTGTQLRISAQLPSGVTILSYAFKGSGFNSDLSGWDTSNVRHFVQTFTNTTNFNQPLSSWDVSSAEDMSNMFASASVFNQDLSSWDVSRVTSMTYMFAQTPQFNNGGQTASANIPGQNPLAWNTPSLSDMSLMFFSAEKFNQSMDNWNTANVTTMYGAFWSAAWFNNGDPKGAFQGDASNSNTVMSWSHGAASTMLSMFRNADAFNQNLDSWNVSRVSSFDTMFFDTADFNNGDRKGAYEGDTYSSNVTMNWRHGASATMKETFKDALAFNQNLNSWDVSRVGSFESTFYNADAFNNGDRIGAYEGDTYSSDVTMSWSPIANNATMLSMFNNNAAFNQNLNSWDVSKVSSLASTFYLATAFNNGDSKLAFEGDTYSSNYIA